MTIELQNKVWSILPKEFKEEVKRMHRIAYSDVDQMIVMITLENVFGHQNLTSDAEGEEMLICEKSKVQRAYNTSREIVKAENPDSLMYSMHTQIMCVLESIFGSKCLPDEEPKPAEHFGIIVKSDFRNERMLHIAAQIVASMIGSDDWTTWRGGSNKEIWHNMAKSSLEIADAPIAECEKGGDNAAEQTKLSNQ